MKKADKVSIEQIDTVDIGGIEYSIELVDDDFKASGDPELTLCGEVDYHNAAIKLSKNVNPQVAPTVLIHEILHAIFYQNGFPEHDEGMILALGYAITYMLKHNPALVEYVTQ